MAPKKFTPEPTISSTQAITVGFTVRLQPCSLYAVNRQTHGKN